VIAVRDVTGDGVADILAGRGTGRGRVKVFAGAGAHPLLFTLRRGAVEPFAG
jgi:hypothetical protein